MLSRRHWAGAGYSAWEGSTHYDPSLAMTLENNFPTPKNDLKELAVFCTICDQKQSQGDVAEWSKAPDC